MATSASQNWARTISSQDPTIPPPRKNHSHRYTSNHNPSTNKTSSPYIASHSRNARSLRHNLLAIQEQQPKPHLRGHAIQIPRPFLNPSQALQQIPFTTTLLDHGESSKHHQDKTCGGAQSCPHFRTVAHFFSFFTTALPAMLRPAIGFEYDLSLLHLHLPEISAIDATIIAIFHPGSWMTLGFFEVGNSG